MLSPTHPQAAVCLQGPPTSSVPATGLPCLSPCPALPFKTPASGLVFVLASASQQPFADSPLCSVTSSKMAVVVDPPRDSTKQLRDVLQYLSPPLLLATFILVAAAHTIRSANARTTEDGTEAKGPGGKPLPVSKRKSHSGDHAVHARKINPTLQRIFQWASAAVTADFVVAGGSIGTHAIVDRATTGEHGWWCGEPKTVSQYL